jgi:osmotically-inducible protein OsmY
MKAALGSLFIVGVLIGGSVSTYAQQTAAKPSEKAIDDRIEARINGDAVLAKREILVTIDNGVVTLTGMVKTDAESAKAARLANVPGVTRVNNNLIVSKDVKDSVKGTAGTIADKTKEGAAKTKDGAEKVADKTKDGAEKGWDKTKEGAAKAGEKTKEGLSKTGEVITDGWITTRVKSKFVGEDLLKDSDINVDTNNNVVTLRGTVMSPAGKARAEAQAKEVEGVRSVINNLVVGPKR